MAQQTERKDEHKKRPDEISEKDLDKVSGGVTAYDTKVVLIKDKNPIVKTP